MIRRCDARDFELMWAIVNDGAQAYKGIIPPDRWTEPYMPAEKLQHEIDDGVVFWGYEDGGRLVGVMGLQQVQDVTLIRHAYVLTANQGQGIGARLLCTPVPADERSGVDRHVGRCRLGDPLLRETRLSDGFDRGKESPAQEGTWTIPERQVETSVVLVDPKWRDAQRRLPA